jgi:murein DD-endopeptidase MepM/ murein hydrolase activator NlpD
MRLPVDDAVITSHYGPRTYWNKNLKRWIVGELHDGLDFVSGAANNSVYAPHTCVCMYDMDNYKEALRWVDKHHSGGNMVIVGFSIMDKAYYMRFLHLIENYIKVGQMLGEGELIGIYGDVGMSSGPHLHNDLYSSSWKKLNIEDFYKGLNLV